MKRIVARWRAWEGDGIEHLVLEENADGFVADAVVLGEGFALRYAIAGDRSWCTRSAWVESIGRGHTIGLRSDGAGAWSEPSLRGAIDIDLTATPFTNTLPIRRLSLERGQAQEIRVAYVDLPAFTVTTARQRYTCLEPYRLYRFEALDSDFTREIEVDDSGLLVSYPGLFRRVL